jgi:hypothetical protein
MLQGSIDYYKAVTDTISKGNVSATQEFFRFFMAPGAILRPPPTPSLCSDREPN